MTTQSKRTGLRIRDARVAAGFTQEQLAFRAGVAVATVSRLENGRTAYPRSDEFARIAAALGTNPDALMGIDDVSPVADDEDEQSDADLDAELDDLTQDTDLVLAFMSRVRDPKQLSRQAKLVIRDDLRRLRARQQRRQG